MTKEDCLNKHDTSRKYIEQTCRPELFAAMDEYAKQREEYWKSRCLAAEEYIEQSPCDLDITSKQIEAHSKWRQLVDNQFIEQQNKPQ